MKKKSGKDGERPGKTGERKIINIYIDILSDGEDRGTEKNIYIYIY